MVRLKKIITGIEYRIGMNNYYILCTDNFVTFK